MNKQSLDIRKITTVLDDGKNIFAGYGKRLKNNFVSDNYHQMYDYNLLTKAFSLSYNIFLLQDIEVLISDVRSEILNILQPDEAQSSIQKLQEHSSLVMSYR